MARRTLLERMRVTPHGWKAPQLRRVLLDAGFILSSIPGKHDVFRHPLSTDLFVTLPRHRPVKAYLVRQALSAIDLVARLEEDLRGPNA